MALIDRGVRSTGKLGAQSPALNAGSDKCGPDQCMLRAKQNLQSRHAARMSAGPSQVVAYDWEADNKDYCAIEKIERRKRRGGATFSPGDAC